MEKESGGEDERIKDLTRLVARFERAREEIIQRRHGMNDNGMVTLDDRLAVNARSLEAVKRTLELAKLEQENRRASERNSKVD